MHAVTMNVMNGYGQRAKKNKNNGRQQIQNDKCPFHTSIGCSLTTKAEPRRVSDVNRESAIESANRRWLRRLVRLRRHHNSGSNFSNKSGSSIFHQYSAFFFGA